MSHPQIKDGEYWWVRVGEHEPAIVKVFHPTPGYPPILFECCDETGWDMSENYQIQFIQRVESPSLPNE